jgi:hypothetical protein
MFAEHINLHVGDKLCNINGIPVHSLQGVINGLGRFTPPIIATFLRIEDNIQTREGWLEEGLDRLAREAETRKRQEKKRLGRSSQPMAIRRFVRGDFDSVPVSNDVGKSMFQHAHQSHKVSSGEEYEPGNQSISETEFEEPSDYSSELGSLHTGMEVYAEFTTDRWFRGRITLTHMFGQLFDVTYDDGDFSHGLERCHIRKAQRFESKLKRLQHENNDKRDKRSQEDGDLSDSSETTDGADVPSARISSDFDDTLHTSDASLSEGENVYANYQQGDEWYPGKIDRITRNGDDFFFGVKYDDGDFEERVARAFVMSMQEWKNAVKLQEDPEAGAGSCNGLNDEEDSSSEDSSSEDSEYTYSSTSEDNEYTSHDDDDNSGDNTDEKLSEEARLRVGTKELWVSRPVLDIHDEDSARTRKLRVGIPQPATPLASQASPAPTAADDEGGDLHYFNSRGKPFDSVQSPGRIDSDDVSRLERALDGSASTSKSGGGAAHAVSPISRDHENRSRVPPPRTPSGGQ